MIALPRRLTVAERERLELLAELDGQTLRRQTGLAGDLVQQAIAGAELAAPAYDRLRSFLGQQQQPAAPEP